MEISQSHVTCLPASNMPLPLLNQNFEVIAGLTNAAKTSATGLRMSISALAAGGELIPTARFFFDCFLIAIHPVFNSPML
jgi:hypothetical protein